MGTPKRTRRTFRELLRDVRGSATSEAVIMLPFFVIVWGCVIFVSHKYERAVEVQAISRQCAWRYAKDNCTGDTRCDLAEGADMADTSMAQANGYDAEGEISGASSSGGWGMIGTVVDLLSGKEYTATYRGSVDKPEVIGGGSATLVGQPQEAHHHRGHEVGVGDGVLVDEIQDLCSVEARHHHDRGTVHEVEQRIAAHGRVVVRTGQQVRAAAVEADPAAEPPEQVEVAVDGAGEVALDALRPAGGAARVVDRQRRALVDGGRLERLGGGEQAVVLLTLDDHPDRCRGGGDRFPRRRLEGRVAEQHGGLGVVEDVGERAGGEADVEGDEDGAGEGHSVVGFEQER